MTDHLHVEQWGTGERPVVFLHGFLGDGEEWRPIAAELPVGIRAVCPDLPGHGRSADVEPSFDNIITRLDAVFDDFAPGGADLVGYSMGGRIALAYALARPARCLSLFVESASPGIEAREERSRRLDQDAHRAARIREIGLREFVREWYRQPLFASLAARGTLLHSLVENRSDGSAEGAARAVEAFSPGRQPNFWPELHRLKMPVSYITGALDTKYAAVGSRFADELPHLRLSIVPEAGHNVHIERPLAYLQALNEHLQATV